MSNYKKPGDIPPFVAASVGKSPEAKLKLIDRLVFDLCRLLDERGYSFKGGADAPRKFFEEHPSAPRIGSEFVRHLLGIVWAEDMVNGMEPMAPNNLAGKKKKFRNN